MSKTFRGSLCLLALLVFGCSGGGSNPNQQLSPVLQDYGLSNYSIQTIRPVFQSDSSFAFEFQIEGQKHSASLTAYSQRSANFQLMRAKADNSLEPIETPKADTFRGTITTSSTESRIAASWSANRLRVALSLAGKIYHIQPVQGLVTSWPGSDDYIVYEAGDLRDDRLLDDIELETAGKTLPQPSFDFGSNISALAIAEIIVDTDFLLFQRLGSNADNVRSYVEATLNEVDHIFQRDLGIRHQINRIIVRPSVAEDPYNNDSSFLHAKLQHHWNTYHQNEPRDLVMLITGQSSVNNLGGIVVQIGSVCDLENAYGLIIYNPLSGYSPAIMTHELGHLWGAVHCNGAPDCAVMCSVIGGCGLPPSGFDQGSRNSIFSSLPSRWCLDYVVPDGTNKPDLVLDNVTVPEVIGYNQTSQVTGVIRNQGATAVTSNVFLNSWLTLDGNPFNNNGDDILMASYPLGLNLSIEPNGQQPFQLDQMAIPLNARFGPQKLVACVDTGAPPCAAVCESNEFNNCVVRDVQIGSDDAQVTHLSAPDTAMSGTAIPVDVTVVNHSGHNLDIPVTLSLGGHWVYGMLPQVPSGEPRVLPLTINAPPGFFDCGNPDSLNLRACANLALDNNRANDCLEKTVGVVENYWDLNVEITYSPQTMALGGYHAWDLRVTNLGNAASEPRQIYTSICLPGVGCVNNYRTFDLGSLNPFQPLNLNVTNFWVPTSALAGWQQVYATVNFNQDFCNANGNNDDARDVFLAQ